MKVLISFSLLLISSWFANAEDHVVRVITDNENGITKFEPKFLTVNVGDTVTWMNVTDDLHNVITYPDGFPEGGSGFKSPYFEQAGDEWSVTFDVQGTYQYHCIPHVLMGMRGVVVVGRPTPVNKFHKPTKDEIMTYRTELLEFFDSDEFDFMPDAVRRNVGK
ncbi:plastocyanin/azurin family copper-binding protein [Kordiimonas aquimaris]|uniref:plastocyanin/azurin family copper-binding protein n=1 Tax=Kordiimonas aquimaris TaxID=707591 RepID=UPI0021CF05CD|nr:plastocyanin/azurin family copper-binding protein [Kordiimonas aquimaris]